MSFEYEDLFLMILNKIVITPFLFSVCGIRSGYRTSQHRVKRIVQGNNADYAEWPWQISLRKGNGTYIGRSFFFVLGIWNHHLP